MAKVTGKRMAAVAGALALVAALATLVTTLGPFAPIRVSVAPAQTASLNPSVFGVGALEARDGRTVEEAGEGRAIN